MSRQVQDLERKLRNAKMEVSNLQSQMQRQRLAALDDSEWTDTSWRRNSNESDIREPIPGFDFGRVREEIIRRSPGLFHVPPAWRELAPSPVGEKDVSSRHDQKNFNPTLPPRPFAEHLRQLFQSEVFAISPYVDLQSFVERAKEMYDTESESNKKEISLNASNSWLVLFFAILALTAQCIQDDIILKHYKEHSALNIPIGRDLADAAAFFFGPATQKKTLDDIRGALVLVVYFKQLNELGAANIWLGLAYKIAQYLGKCLLNLTNRLGCHRYTPGLSRGEEAARADVWWDIYLFDRCHITLPI
jgi:hypothetical protein